GGCLVERKCRLESQCGRLARAPRLGRVPCAPASGRKGDEERRLTSGSSSTDGGKGDGEDLPLDALARAAQSGDGAAQDRFVRQVHALVTAVVTRRLGAMLTREAGCEDVVQDVMTTVAQQFPRFTVRGEGSLRQWLLTLVENRIRDLHDFHVRAEKRSTSRKLSLEELRPTQPDDEEHPSLASDDHAVPKAAMDREMLELSMDALA